MKRWVLHCENTTHKTVWLIISSIIGMMVFFLFIFILSASMCIEYGVKPVTFPPGRLSARYYTIRYLKAYSEDFETVKLNKFAYDEEDFGNYELWATYGYFTVKDGKRDKKKLEYLMAFKYTYSTKIATPVCIFIEDRAFECDFSVFKFDTSILEKIMQEMGLEW